MDLPFDKSYWAIPEVLLAGCYPGSKGESEKTTRLGSLLSLGISTVINLMEPDERDRNGDPFNAYEDDLIAMAHSTGGLMECVRFPIRDLSVPSKKQMVEILDVIDHAHDQNRAVYVHCWGGRGRTGTVVGCYLIRQRLVPSENVIVEIETLRSRGNGMIGRSPETHEQKEFVLSWGKEGFI